MKELKAEAFEYPVIWEEKPDIYFGSGIFTVLNKPIERKFKLTCLVSKAYISVVNPFRLDAFGDNMTFEGTLENGSSVKGTFGDHKLTNHVLIVECKELFIGEVNEISSIETKLIGAYFEYDFSFEYENFLIELFKSDIPFDIAVRTHKINHTVLPGSRIKLSGSYITFDEANKLFRDLSYVLRPITSSEVYYRAITLNDGEAKVYSSDYIFGKLFGYNSNILSSPRDMKLYLQKALVKYIHGSKEDRITILAAGHDLATSAACGLQETSLMLLIASLNRLGGLASKKKSVWSNHKDRKVYLKQLKKYIVLESQSYIKTNTNPFSANEIVNIETSIKLIDYIDSKFIREIKTHLQDNGWSIQLDFQLLKKIRDNLMHTGLTDPTISMDEKHELQMQLEEFHLVHILDLIGFNGWVSTEKNGWRTYSLIEDIKKKLK